MFILCRFIIKHKRIPRKNTSLVNDRLFYDIVPILDTPIRKQVSDKVCVKKYLADLGLSRYCVPTLSVLEEFSEAEIYKFNCKTIVKPAHASGTIFTFDEYESISNECLREICNLNHYNKTRETNYRYLRHRAIIEPFLESADSLLDFKAFIFDGTTSFYQLGANVFGNNHRSFFDHNGRYLFSIDNKMALIESTELPVQVASRLHELRKVEKVVGRHLSNIRVDFLLSHEHCFIGELTNFHWSGLDTFGGLKSEKLLGDLIKSRLKEGP